MAATHLAVRRQPFGAASGVVIDYQPILEARNADETVDTTYTGTVTANGTGLSGTVAVAAVNGVITWTDLTVTGTSAVSLGFSASGLTGTTSSSFTPVTPQYDAFALSLGVYIELPRAAVDTSYPTISSSVTVGVGKDYPTVQAALNALVAADTPLHREIICSNNEVVGDSCVIPARAAGMGWIIIRSATLPTALTRITKGSSIQLAMPKITGEYRLGIVAARAGAHHVRFVGIWIDVPTPSTGDSFECNPVVDFSGDEEIPASGTVSATNGAATFSVSQAAVPFFGPGSTIIAGGSYYGIRTIDSPTTATLTGTVTDKFGNPGTLPSFAATTFAVSHPGNITAQPNYMGLDRCMVSGSPTIRIRKGVSLNGTNQFVIHSAILDVHDFRDVPHGGSVIGGVTHYGGGFADTNAITAVFGMGPYLIHNNRLQGAGENTMFGGTDPSTLDVVQSDITVTRNFYDKPLAWQGVYPVKNTCEFKNARRVLVDGNIFDGSWIDAQDGYGILYNTAHQNGSAPWTVTRDVVHRKNFHRNMSTWMQLAGNAGDWYLGVQENHVAIYDNLAVNINGVEAFDGGHNNRAMLYAGMATTLVRHNTVLAPLGNATKALSLEPNTAGCQYDDNLTVCQSYGVFASGYGPGKTSIAAGLPSDLFTKNALIGYPGAQSDFLPEYPNYFLADYASCGFATPGITSTWDTADPDAVCAALELTSAGTTDLRTAASDGAPVGVRDMTALRSAIAGVWEGTPASGTAHHFALSVSATPSLAGQPLARQPVIAVQDVSNATVTSDTSSVTASLVVESGSASPTGTLTKSAVAGLATFTDLGLAASSVIGSVCHWRYSRAGLPDLDGPSFTVLTSLAPSTL